MVFDYYDKNNYQEYCSSVIIIDSDVDSAIGHAYNYIYVIKFLILYIIFGKTRLEYTTTLILDRNSRFSDDTLKNVNPAPVESLDHS